jgi:hypothetical protein
MQLSSGQRLGLPGRRTWWRILEDVATSPEPAIILKSAFGNHGLHGFYGLCMSYENTKFHLLGEDEQVFKFSILSVKSVNLTLDLNFPVRASPLRFDCG